MVNGPEIKRRRERLKLSQFEAASRIGWTGQRWSDFERGRYPDPRVSTLRLLSGVLGCGIDALLTAPDSAPDSKPARRSRTQAGANVRRRAKK